VSAVTDPLLSYRGAFEITEEIRASGPLRRREPRPFLVT
jgi:hypothetical protein